MGPSTEVASTCAAMSRFNNVLARMPRNCSCPGQITTSRAAASYRCCHTEHLAVQCDMVPPRSLPLTGTARLQHKADECSASVKLNCIVTVARQIDHAVLLLGGPLCSGRLCRQACLPSFALQATRGAGPCLILSCSGLCCRGVCAGGCRCGNRVCCWGITNQHKALRVLCRIQLLHVRCRVMLNDEQTEHMTALDCKSTVCVVLRLSNMDADKHTVVSIGCRRARVRSTVCHAALAAIRHRHTPDAAPQA